MSQQTLQRLSGVALLVGGLLFAIGNLLHPIDPSPSKAHASATWMAAHVTFMVGMLGILLGLPTLYTRQAERAGLLGLLGFIAFFLGIASNLTRVWFEAYAVPMLDETAIEAVETGPGVPFMVAGGLLFLAGQIAFGIATYRARVYPPAAALVLIGSGVVLPLALGMTGTVMGLLISAAAAVLGVTLAVLGGVLLISAGVSSPEHRPYGSP